MDDVTGRQTDVSSTPAVSVPVPCHHTDFRRFTMSNPINHDDFLANGPAPGSDEHLLWLLEQLGQVLACRPTYSEERSWVTEAINVSVRHPKPAIALALTGTCSLRQLRVLVTNPDPGVRRACARNPFNLDLDIQLALASDSDERVVHALLDQVDPYLEVMPALLTSPHVSVRRRLAHHNLLDELLVALSNDDDPEAAVFAALALQFRHGDLAGAR